MRASPRSQNIFLALSLSLFCLAAGNSRAVVIEFTEGEGYSNGALGGQTPTSGHTWNAWSEYFTVNTSGGGSVLATTGTGEFSPPARYSQAFSSTAGQTLFLAMDFQFVGLDLTTPFTDPADRQTAASLNFGSSSNVFSTLLGGTLGTYEFISSGTTYGFQVTSWENVEVDPAALGVDSDGGEWSDHLRLTLTTTVAGAGNSAYTMTLINIDSNQEIFSLSGSVNLTGINDLYAAFSGGASQTATTSMITSQLEISSVPEPGALSLLLGGFGVLCLRRKRRP